MKHAVQEVRSVSMAWSSLQSEMRLLLKNAIEYNKPVKLTEYNAEGLMLWNTKPSFR